MEALAEILGDLAVVMLFGDDWTPSFGSFTALVLVFVFLGMLLRFVLPR